EQSGISFHKTSDYGAIPHQHPAVLYCFCAVEISRRVRQDRPTAEQISWSNPLKQKLSALFRNKEKSGESFRQQEKIVGRVTLVADHRMGEVSAFCRSCQHCLAIRRSQSIEEMRFQALGYRSNSRGNCNCRCVSLSGNGPNPFSRRSSGKTIPPTLVKEPTPERRSSRV